MAWLQIFKCEHGLKKHGLEKRDGIRSVKQVLFDYKCSNVDTALKKAMLSKHGLT